MDTNELKSKLSAFGGNVRDSAGRLTKSAVDGSRKVTEKLRVQNRIRKAENKLKETYIAIGRKYEEVYGSKNDPDFIQYMADIADARAQIAAARTELSSLDKAFVCTKCGKFVTENQNFCPYCGTKIFRNAPIVDAEIVESSDEETTYEEL